MIIGKPLFLQALILATFVNFYSFRYAAFGQSQLVSTFSFPQKHI